MALNVAQYEEISALLQQVPRLVDRLESRQSGFAEGVLAWLKQAETALQSNRLPVVSQVASCRAMLIAAARGVQAKEVVFVGRPTPRKVQDATAGMALERGNELLHGVIAERQGVFQDAERIAGQVIAVAAARGLVGECGGGQSHHQFLQCVQQKVAADPDLASACAHLVALVGKTDILVFLDRALAKAAN